MKPYYNKVFYLLFYCLHARNDSSIFTKSLTYSFVVYLSFYCSNNVSTQCIFPSFFFQIIWRGWGRRNLSVIRNGDLSYGSDQIWISPKFTKVVFRDGVEQLLAVYILQFWSGLSALSQYKLLGVFMGPLSMKELDQIENQTEISSSISGQRRQKTCYIR